ncbi:MULTISPECIES: hypothetical protein [unclassified Streptomyces]|uniref:hypothetical protein n=1 Tax=unclassified Streptomyces TaxID=2593676 RepID=UPI002741F5FD|nr:MULTISPECIES: hypothetical protein [unclassified Streptomyces]
MAAASGAPSQTAMAGRGTTGPSLGGLLLAVVVGGVLPVVGGVLVAPAVAAPTP